MKLTKNKISLRTHKIYYKGLFRERFKRSEIFSRHIYVYNQPAFNIVKDVECVENWNKIDLDQLIRGL